MNALSVIKSEHRNLGAILHTLDQLIVEIQSGKTADFKILHGIMTYLDRFLNTYHHPKEDTYLMPVLVTRYPDASGVIAEFSREHKDGEILFCKMIKALSAFEFTEDLAYSSFDILAREYIQFELAHAGKEERKLLPLVEKHFTANDWKILNDAFIDNKDPLFSEQPSAEFRDLYTRIVNTVPAPHGFGQQWE